MDSGNEHSGTCQRCGSGAVVLCLLFLRLIFCMISSQNQLLLACFAIAICFASISLIHTSACPVYPAVP